jgi:prephenate dehydratase
MSIWQTATQLLQMLTPFLPGTINLTCFSSFPQKEQVKRGMFFWVGIHDSPLLE